MTDHPAKFSPEVLTAIVKSLPPRARTWWALDPFAGIGTIHSLPGNTVGIEIEEEWASEHPDTIWGDCLEVMRLYPDKSWDAIITSPCFGNRLADNHNAQDPSKRITYRHVLGRKPDPKSSATMQWNKKYRDFHEKVWAEGVRILKPNGLFVLDISDHIRKGQIQPVTAWHLRTLLDLNLHVKDIQNVPTHRMGFGANRDLRVPFEHVITLSKWPQPYVSMTTPWEATLIKAEGKLEIGEGSLMVSNS